MFAGIWWIEDNVFTIQIGYQYDYAFWRAGLLLFGLKWAIGVLIFVAVVNLISAAIHSARRRL